MEILLLYSVCPRRLLSSSGAGDKDYGVKSGFGTSRLYHLGQCVIPAGRVGF